MTDLSQSSPEKPDEQAHYAAVGKVASNWAYLELVIDDWAIRIADLGVNTAICFTAQVIGPARKFDALIALCDLLAAPPELQKELRSFSERVIGAGERRNRAVHDPWIVEEGSKPARFQVTARKKVVRELVFARDGEIGALAAEIGRLTDEMDDLGRRLYDRTAEQRKSLPKAYNWR